MKLFLFIFFSLFLTISSIHAKSTDSLLTCVMNNYEEAFENVEHPGFPNKNVLFFLSKTCKATVTDIEKVVPILQFNLALAPEQNTVSKYVMAKIKSLMKDKELTNKKMYTDSFTFETVPFSIKFYLVDTDPNFDYQNISTHIQPLTPNFVREIGGGADLISALPSLLDGRTQAKYSYIYKGKLYCNYAFSITGQQGTGKRVERKAFFGVISLSMPIHDQV